MFRKFEIERRLDRLERFKNDLVKWALITDEFRELGKWIKMLAGEVVREENKSLRTELSSARADTQLLLDHLGLELVTVGTKEIRKKVIKKGKK